MMGVQQLFKFVFILLLFIQLKLAATESNEPILLVISFDAFKRNYLEGDETYYLKKFAGEGVRASNMGNCFPTKTFPNHFSIGTGRYPGSHGVIANDLYDKKYGYLTYGELMFHFDPDITPIWTLNEKNGHRSGVMMWPGSNFKYNGRRCTYTEELDKNVTMYQRFDKVMKWILSEKPPNFVMLYVEQPDEEGHAYSPDSKQEMNMVSEVDRFVYYINNRIKFENLQDRINIIILSDHGMTTITPRNFIDLYEYVDRNVCQMYGSSPVLQVICKNNRTAEACANLTAAGEAMKLFDAYTDSQLKPHWHVYNERRFYGCNVVAKFGNGFQDMYDYITWFNRNRGIEITMDTKYGIHGYDNSIDDMKPIFIAKGPSFKSGVVVNDEFFNIDLYPMFCRLLKIPCIPTDGEDRTNIWEQMFK